MNVDLQALKVALIHAIDDYVTVHGNGVIPLDQSLYWTIMDEHRYDMSEKPQDLGVGNIEEEYSSIMRHIQDDEHLGAVDMQHLAGVLAWLSAKAGEASSIPETPRS